MKTTRNTSYQDEVGRWQQKLGEARADGDQDAEIAALLAIGDVALEEAPDLAFAHFRLAEKVIRHADRRARLHEALGGQGRAFRRQKLFADANDRYLAAEAAAKAAGNRAARVRWLLRRASALRANDELSEAKVLIEQAENLLRPPPTGKSSLQHFISKVNFFDKQQVATLAELEGQIGLTLVRENDEQGAEDHYRSALSFSEMAEDWDAVSTWATNLSNAYVRRGKYSQALDCYERALAAGLKQAGRGGSVLNTAMRLADCQSKAYRHEEGGDRLRKLARTLADERLKLFLLERALRLYDQGLCKKKVIDTAKAIEALADGLPVAPDWLAKVQSMRAKMEGFTGRQTRPAAGPPALDIFLLEYMIRAEKSCRVEPALEAAYLVCDVRLALALAGERQWQRLIGGDLLANPGLDMRVVSDTLRMLLEARQTEEALELLQRFKAPSFCVPTLLRLQQVDAPRVEVSDYLAAVREVSAQVAKLKAPARPDFMRTINAIRRASARMREAGEALRELDSLLLAQIGEPMHPGELLDALPYAGGVGILDFFIGRDVTVGVVLTRGQEGVETWPFITEQFNATHAHQLSELHHKGNLPKQLGGAHTEALLKISKLLHDNFFCKLARELSQRGVNQLILIPDVLTRNLPLHLSYACGSEFHIPGVDTADARFLCEVMPMEFAPCLQAVAASQVYLRPRAIKQIAAFADPRGDLPGVRAALEEFGRSVTDQAGFRLASGADATKPAVLEAMKEADVLMFGTHGIFSPSDLEQTHLVLSGEPWTMGDMLRMPELQKRTLLVLVACEAGAVASTPDERNAWGIPGALVAAGASAVLANLWPVENLTAGILLERFLSHLAYPGYRPAAALFRAVHDLRRMERDEALARCRQQLEYMKQNKTTSRVLVGARTLLEWLEDTDEAHPFAHPIFWGATVVFGSGWHLPAGAVVGPPQVTIENRLRLSEASDLVTQWQPGKALELAKQVAACADGVPRGHAYTIMALSLLRSADLSSEQRVQQKAARLLKMAARIATNEGDDDLRSRVAWVQSQLEEDHVA